jgi:hypothetical protein
MKEMISMKTQIIQRITCLIILFLVSTTALYAQKNPTPQPVTDPAVKSKVMESYGKLPLYFIENKGQMEKPVRFYISGAGGRLFFTKDSIVSEIIKRETVTKSSTAQPHATDTTNEVVEQRLVLVKKYLKMSPKMKLVGQDPLPGKVNVFRGNDASQWKNNIPTYKKVCFQNLYPGIDLVYQGSIQNLEPVYNVSSGANPNKITFTIQGVDKLAITPQGDLEMHTSLGVILEKKLVALQAISANQTREIDCQYLLSNSSTLRLSIKSYDSHLPLIIK